MRSRKIRWTIWGKLLIGGILLGGIVRLQGTSAQEQFTGTVNDLMCGAKHNMIKNATARQYTLACVRLGSKYDLVVGDKVYELEGKSGDLEKVAGKSAKITGTPSENTLLVTSVSQAD